MRKKVSYKLSAVNVCAARILNDTLGREALIVRAPCTVLKYVRSCKGGSINLLSLCAVF